MPTKVELLTAKYGTALNDHFNALEQGFDLSLQGNYGANEWFRDVARAGERAGRLCLESWQIVFPGFRTCPVKIKAGTTQDVTEVFAIPDHGNLTWGGGQRLVKTARDYVNFVPQIVGQNHQTLLVSIPGGANGKAASVTPYTWSETQGGATLFTVQLYIIP